MPVFAPEGARLGRVAATRIAAGDTFVAAGFQIEALGGKHAQVWDAQEPCANLGFVVEKAFYHPGDALAVPDAPVHTFSGSTMDSSTSVA